MKGMCTTCFMVGNFLLKVMWSTIPLPWSTLLVKALIFVGLQIWTLELIIWLVNLLNTTCGQHLQIKLGFQFLLWRYIDMLHMWNKNIKKLPFSLLLKLQGWFIPCSRVYGYNTSCKHNLKKDPIVHLAIIKATFMST
jgi:hypothetical protein